MQRKYDDEIEAERLEEEAEALEYQKIQQLERVKSVMEENVFEDKRPKVTYKPTTPQNPIDLNE
jgi:hypothetical protein